MKEIIKLIGLFLITFSSIMIGSILLTLTPDSNDNLNFSFEIVQQN